MGGNPVTLGALPKVLLSIKGLRLQWGGASRCHLLQALRATPLETLPPFSNEDGIPCTGMPFKLLSGILEGKT